MTRVAETVVALLEHHGVDTVFGIPGVHTIELYRALANSSIRTITSRHEQGAAFMADGYARVSGRPGVCVLITGPGVTNAATPIAQAFHDSIPLLILASATRSDELGRGFGSLHDLPDQAELLRTITHHSEIVVDPARLPGVLATAFSHLGGSVRHRPIHIGIPHDVLGELAPPLAPQRAMPVAAPSPDDETLREAARLLQRSSCPVIIVGGGGSDAVEEFRSFAERLDAPVVMTGNGRGVLSSDHRLSLGSALPMASVRELIHTSDVAVLVGCELADVEVIYNGSQLELPGTIVRLDVDEHQLEQRPLATIALGGDASDTLAALDRCMNDVEPRPRGGESRVRDAIEHFEWTDYTYAQLPWLDALSDALPRDRIVAVDSTQLGYSAHHYMHEYRPRSWLAPFGYGTLGPALPMAIGAKLAAPERPVAAIVGDGGMLFTLSELATAVDLGLPIAVVLWDNDGYGEIRDAFDKAGAPRLGTDVSTGDLLHITEGFGCATTDVDAPSDLKDALQAAFAADRPTVMRLSDP